MPSRPAAVLLALLVGGGALPGCATVPESSDLQVVRSFPIGPQVAPPPGPARGVDPFRLVREFIEATGSPANGHAAARAFLTREAAATWDDAAGITVIEDAPGATPEATPGQGLSRVQVGGPRLGRIEPDGSFTPLSGRFSLQFTVVKELGEWRIIDPPPGVLVESSNFQRNYRQVRVSFVDPSRGTLVPDVRWVPAHPATTLAGRILDLLFGGPSEALDGAVVSALPEGVRTRSNVLVSSDGRTVIDLAGLGGLGEPERRLIAAQLVNTLDGLVPAPLRLLADGQPLVAGQPEWNAADITSHTSAAGPRPDATGKVVIDGRLRGLDGVPVPGPAGNGMLTVRSAATSSPGGDFLAVVVSGSDGRPELRVGRTGRNLTAVPMDAASMTRPTWRPAGTEVWTVINGNTVAGVAVSDTGPSAPFQVNTSELAEFGPITELRISRDGVRAAVVAGGRLVVAAIVNEPGEVSLRHPRVLREGDLPPTAAVDWARSELLVVASAGPVPKVSSVSVDGLTRREVRNTNLTGPLTGIIAAPGREVVVSDATGLWAYSDTQEVWEPVLGGVGPAAVPLYPG
ncbi:MAG TPA: LpqB family beta-propeller domain-containing protein [Pseudonocardiaceae bacterium]|nr:LpqB family beta-propeller domain-containing protein [Pseudonocardiaceae bacterium]